MTASATAGVDGDLDPVGTEPSRRARAFAWAWRHPVVAVALLAAVVRVAAAVVIAIAGDLHIPDERQYVGLARTVARGDDPEAWKPGYGALLMSTVGTFTWPLSALFWLFEPWRILGQLLAAAGGAAAASATALLGLLVRGRRVALVAGAIVALWPSQVLWSAVVLRESFVWAVLASVAVTVHLAARARTPRQLVWALLGALVALFLLAHLREQTFVAVVWCAALYGTFAPGRWRVQRAAMLVVFAVLLPVEADKGPGGFTYVESHLGRLSESRAELAEGAETALVPTTTTTGVATTDVPGTTRTGPDQSPDREPAAETTSTSAGAPPDRAAPEEVLEDDAVTTNVRAFPRGLVAFLFRPFPGEATTSTEAGLAAAENILWYVLYVAAGTGLVAAHRQRLPMGLPVLILGAIVVLNSVAQGNVGTAFRHRGQILWILALASAIAVDAVRDRARPLAGPVEVDR